MKKEQTWFDWRNQRNFERMLVGFLMAGGLGWYLSQYTAPASDSVPESLPVVRINMNNGHFFIPGCEDYKDVPDKYLLEVPTVQEAELSGYRPDPWCSFDKRIATEKQRFGNIPVTPEMLLRKQNNILREKIRDE